MENFWKQRKEAHKEVSLKPGLAYLIEINGQTRAVVYTIEEIRLINEAV